MKKTILLTAICITSSLGAFAQNVNIPDANFKAYLVGNSAINTNSDTEIQVSEAIAFNGWINCQSSNISDLTGIEHFINITYLIASNNQLTSIDVSQNTALLTLNVQDNNLSSIDVSQNTALTGLNCSQNNLSILDINQNLALEELYCSENNLSVLDVSQHTNLISINCSQNNISTLDFSQNTGINQSTIIDIPFIDCQLNNLTVLKMTGINATMLENQYFKANGNPNLTCIEVNDVAAATTAWTNIDATASFSLDCNATSSINDEKASIEIQIFPNPTTTQLNIKTENKVIHAKIIDGIGRTIDVNLSNDNIIDVSKLSSGIYQLQIETDKGFAIKKFIKE